MLHNLEKDAPTLIKGVCERETSCTEASEVTEHVSTASVPMKGEAQRPSCPAFHCAVWALGPFTPFPGTKSDPNSALTNHLDFPFNLRLPRGFPAPSPPKLLSLGFSVTTHHSPTPEQDGLLRAPRVRLGKFVSSVWALLWRL